MCSGNNVIAYKSSTSGTAPQTSTGLNFVYTQNPAQAPTVTANKDAAIVNAFYIINSVHDISYKYAFSLFFEHSIDVDLDSFR